MARDRGRETDGAKLRLNQYLDRWLETAEMRLRERTFEDYQYLLNKHVRPRLGERRLAAISPLDIQAIYKQMLDRKLSARTVHYAHTVLGSALRQAVKWQLLEQSPAAGVQLPRVHRTELKVLDLEQSRVFLKTAVPTYYGTLFAVAVTTGMRPSEYLALKWSDVNFERGTVSVSRTLTKSWRGWAFNETKRARSRRVIRLQSWIVRLLEQLRIDRAGKTPQFAEWPDAAELVFKTTKGTPVAQGYLVTKCFKPLLKQAGLPNIRLYDLRHTAATLGLFAGVPPKVVSEQLGHSNAAFTLAVYSHVMPHMQEEAAAKVEAILLADGALVSDESAAPAKAETRAPVPFPEIADRPFTVGHSQQPSREFA